MNDAFDALRSFVREGLQRAALPVRACMPHLQKALNRRDIVPTLKINQALARAPGITAVTTQCRPPELHIHATLDEGEQRHYRIRPDCVRFAPQGAKELIVAVSPRNTQRDPILQALVIALSQCVARAVWPLLTQQLPWQQALHTVAECEEDERLRVDLRTLPELRQLEHKAPPMRLMLEAITLDSMVVQEEGIQLQLGIGGISP